jgi:hypothetical protein
MIFGMIGAVIIAGLMFFLLAKGSREDDVFKRDEWGEGYENGKGDND